MMEFPYARAARPHLLWHLEVIDYVKERGGPPSFAANTPCAPHRCRRGNAGRRVAAQIANLVAETGAGWWQHTNGLAIIVGGQRCPPDGSALLPFTYFAWKGYSSATTTFLGAPQFMFHPVILDQLFVAKSQMLGAHISS